MTQPEALRLADLIRSRHGNDINDEAAAELRRLHAERAAADGVINDLVAKVRELQKENECLAAALASSCDEQRHELWESGGIAGCERARVAERQRDALLEVLLGVEKRCSHSGYVGKDGQFLKVIQAAIAKATGETA